MKVLFTTLDTKCVLNWSAEHVYVTQTAQQVYYFATTLPRKLLPPLRYNYTIYAG